MISLHTVGILAATAALAGGISELGRALGGADLAGRWVRGWTLLWWLMALVATITNPAVAAVVGSLVVLGAFAVWGWRERTRARPWLVGGGAVVAGAPLILCPPVFYDALVYHLGLPWTWLVNGSFAPIPHHVFSHFPIAAQAVFLIPVGWGIPEAAAGLHWMCLAVALAASLRLAQRLGAGRWSVLAPLLLLGCWHIVWIAGQPAVDLLVAVAVVAAADALTVDPEPRWLDLGLACGLAAATKYPAVVPVAALLLTALAFFPARWRRLGLAAGVAGAVASFVPLRNLLLTGNPVYPLLWSLLGGAGWTARDNSRWEALVHEGVGGAGSLATGLVRLVRPPDGLGWWLAVAAVLAAVAAVDRSAAGRHLRVLLTAAGVMVGGWLVTSQTVRYAFPVAVLVSVLAAVGVSRLPRAAAVTAAAAAAAAVAIGAADLAGFALGRLEIQRMWLGEATREEWRHRVTVNDPLPAYRLVEEGLHPSAQVLVVGEGRSWGCRAPHHVSSPYDLQLIQAWVEAAPDSETLARALAAEGWSHMLINWGELQRLGGPAFQVLRWEKPADAERWQHFLDQWTVPIAASAPCELRVIRPPYMGTNSHPR